MDTIETFTVGRYTVRIEHDPDPESPREWSNLGTMVCWHSRYTLGDKHTYASPEDFRESDDYKHALIVLPLFLLDHSGITMRTHDFSDCDPGQWDSGQVGYIYVTRDTVLHEYSCKRIGKRTRKLAESALRAEVHAYDEYLTGQVYGYIVERDGVRVDSCWGFYGLDYCKEQARASAESWNVEDARIDKLQLDTL